MPITNPPAHLLADSAIKVALEACKDHIRVDTPFNVDKLERILFDHPNPLFVQSIMHGLRHGFWPPDDGEWKVEMEEVFKNYLADSPDIDAIRAFQDKELSAGRWSSELSQLLPDMKISLMFPRVVMDHFASGLNDGIPCTAATIRYDNMCDFGQEM
ncbi:uncharacterized protein LAESUDRAFT_734877 [Laetiporus sulphureus 93-53]|uniref:Uncharacterized protein n=1 Tax=Laetiporus sulphureus 93-53 TaxID=1314785 RepID=A0A165GKK7_9APHY|nr:uncharacterized protein LAESUDRAFT_734877 [Laetiporus sulphureus 93-53]KZT10481.1 hypothetical protein LAESUDRAFT_734877 [Laetiporus sulphureus 93-53]